MEEYGFLFLQQKNQAQANEFTLAQSDTTEREWERKMRKKMRMPSESHTKCKYPIDAIVHVLHAATESHAERSILLFAYVF